MTSPIERRHREQAAETLRLNLASFRSIDALPQWIASGEWWDDTEHYSEARNATALAQAFANLEAAVRREYSELRHLAASAARMLRDGDERDVSGRIFNELETLKNG